MKIKHTILVIVALAVLFIAPAKVRADPLTFALTNTQSGTAGATLTFSAIVSNNGISPMSAVTITGNAFNIQTPSSGSLTLDDTSFFDNFEGRTLNFGQSIGSLPTFTVTIGAGTMQGNYTGSFTIFYIGATGMQSVTQDFSIAVVPEPATMLMLGTGLAGLVAAGRRRSKVRWQQKQ